MKNFINKNLKSITFFIAIAIIVFISYFLDKDLSKVLGVAGFFFWFLREYSKQLLAKDLEEFKSKLQNESIKFKIKYENLHSERAEVIKQVYKNIVRTYTALFQYFLLDFSLLQMDLENYKKINKGIVDKLQACTNYFVENRIYFKEDLAQKIDKLILNYTEIKVLIDNNKKNNSKFFEGVTLNLEKLILKEKKDKEIWERINKQLPEIQKEIENDFRTIIGINNKTNGAD